MSSEQHSADQLGISGAVAWVELTRNPHEGARDFYQALFGWDAESMPMPEGTYTLFRQGGHAVAGMMQQPPVPDMSTQWLVNFSVADCDAAAAQARDLGAEVITPPTDLPGFGRVAAFCDPQGAYFAIVQR